MARSIKYLEEKMHYHEDKANEYFSKIKVIEDKQRLIGFKTSNDNRKSSDLPQLIECKLPYNEAYWI